MKKTNVLNFPARPPSAKPGEPLPSTVVFQVGRDRMAVHFWYEDLPPATPLLVLERPKRKGRSKRTSLPDGMAGQSIPK
jgi:hypothetical protein